ncbi:MAG TPA: hypothetical protein VMT35_13745 [Ignavibacteriaceae bacterium]|nr:hypothetical protein [Ignavibacteriaceae bacterium]
MYYKILLSFLLFFIMLPFNRIIFAQEDQEPVVYYQMEPLDDSLFIKIQQEVFIDPPDPKAEIIVDLRDANNQTVSIRGTLYPFLAFTPETRAKITTYPFKINLEENINYGSVFTRVLEKIRIGKVFAPPTRLQISSGLQYINPFLQIMGGERLGIPLKDDLGFSFGIGTPYSGVLETNMIEANFHMLGAFGGFFNSLDGLTDLKAKNSHNNLYVTLGYQIGYVIPFGNFFQVSYSDVINKPTETEMREFTKRDTMGYHAKIVTSSSFNWELRYPISVFGSTRGKFYVARYFNEWHAGYTGRELSLAGSTFDLRFDIMPHSDVRQAQYVVEALIQRVAANWGFSAFAIGPSLVISYDDRRYLNIISLFLNARLKVGTSL